MEYREKRPTTENKYNLHITELFQLFGVKITEMEILATLDSDSKQHIRNLLQYKNINQAWETEYGIPPSTEDTDTLHGLLTSIFAHRN